MKEATRRQVFAKLLRHYLRIPGRTRDRCSAAASVCQLSGLGTMRDRLEVLRHRLPVVVSPATAAALERDRWREDQLPRVSGLVA
jgi:hypothetical protein